MTNFEMYKTKVRLLEARRRHCAAMEDCENCPYVEEPDCSLSFACDDYDGCFVKSEILDVMKEVCALVPQLRFTQIISNLANGDGYYISDEEFLEKIEKYRNYLLEKESKENG